MITLKHPVDYLVAFQSNAYLKPLLLSSLLSIESITFLGLLYQRVGSSKRFCQALGFMVLCQLLLNRGPSNATVTMDFCFLIGRRTRLARFPNYLSLNWLILFLASFQLRSSRVIYHHLNLIMCLIFAFLSYRLS